MIDDATILRWERGLKAIFDGQMLLADLRAQSAAPIPLTGCEMRRPEEDFAFLEGVTQQHAVTYWYGRP